MEPGWMGSKTGCKAERDLSVRTLGFTVPSLAARRAYPAPRRVLSLLQSCCYVAIVLSHRSVRPRLVLRTRDPAGHAVFVDANEH